MTFELLPNATPWLIAFAAVALITVVLAVASITDFVVSNRKTRLARHQSIRSYYGGLTLSH